jgi:hypothetical protein
MTEHPAAVLARHLAAHAEDVCRQYLSNGRRAGHYWIVGDVNNSKGRSLYVRLDGPLSGQGTAGKWTDAATGEQGDLLDLIRLRCAFGALGAAMDEARSFLALPRPTTVPGRQPSYGRRSTPEAARRLFRAGRPIPGTPAEGYLRARGITAVDSPMLRFHPFVHYRAHDQAPLLRLPAMLAAITDLDGHIVGVNRTWLDVERLSVADFEAPRKGPRRPARPRHPLPPRHRPAPGRRGHRDGPVAQDRAARAAHGRGTHRQPPGGARPASLSRALVIARDNGAAGVRAAARLRDRAEAQGIVVHDLVTCLDDFNDDRRCVGATQLRRVGTGQLSRRSSSVRPPAPGAPEEGVVSRSPLPSPAVSLALRERARAGLAQRAIYRRVGRPEAALAPRPQWRDLCFSPARPPHATAHVDPAPRLPRAAKNTGPAILRWRSGPRGAAPARLRSPIAGKAATGAAVRRKETTHGDQRHQPP